MRARVLVIGAMAGSLGEAVVLAAEAAGYSSMTAGISKQESIYMDCFLAPMRDLRATLMNIQPKYIVNTAGVNMPFPGDVDDLQNWYRWHFEANVIGPMRLLDAFNSVSYEPSYVTESGYLHYVAISSNSARLPRSNSAAYCASKAALSMAIRVAAREGVGGDATGILTYAYEPGLLRGTPMTERTKDKFAGVLHRMRGTELENGIDPTELAALIVRNFKCGPAINGTIIPYDSDEL